MNRRHVGMSVEKNNMYQELESILKQKIDSGVWEVGEKIPSSNALQIKYKMSRTTVRHALADLERDGYIETKKGKGSFVLNPNVFDRAIHYFDVVNTISDLGYEARVELTGFTILVNGELPHVRELIALSEDDYLYELHYTMFANEEATFFDTVYLDYNRFPELHRAELNHGPLLPLLVRKYNFKPHFHTGRMVDKMVKPNNEPNELVEDVMRVTTKGNETDGQVVLYGEGLSFGELMAKLR